MDISTLFVEKKKILPLILLHNLIFDREHPGGTRVLKNLFEQRKMHSRPCCRTGRHLICNPYTLRRVRLQLWQ